MTTFSDYVADYREQLAKGGIQRVYRGLMEFMNDLKAQFNRNCPQLGVSSGLYPGYLDMTYFALVPPSLKTRQLKIAVVFIHSTASFEVWLAAANRQVQAKYWELLKGRDWGEYRVVTPGKGIDAILIYNVAPHPDFDNLGSLKKQIEEGTLNFVSRIEEVLRS
ncbi:DUF7000 family protein [Dehalogenimonas etheniformans]|uniref:DUF7000 domain-containing protein n=1 Tax=Dehalogenimonas etheniformans TaxID=1536648 RepID=A0A2P5P4S1_9CHLR|nr:hypothetical protein [Dehalogenimonas etheniformans]PPD57291.1 hypothetical protein JP09_009590 [Dehalogenimonas etheniformans]QNT77007.1 hypothetical protein HX448_10140 [Dehalogenimonas etheniformans]